MAGSEDETLVRPGRMASAEPGPDYAVLDDVRRFDGGGLMRAVTETKPFFLTSEFFAVLAALVALAVTTASSDSLDAGLAWALAAGIVAAYVLGRGAAKSGTPSRAWDPRETLLRRPDGDPHDPHHHDQDEEREQMSTVPREDYSRQGDGATLQPRYMGYGGGAFMRQQFPVETKPFFLTSEFWLSLAMIVGAAIAAGTSESIDARLFWTLAAAITIGYVISRGIAKSGTKSRAWDPRDDLMQGARERMTHGNG
jgi:hypothetical protein